LTAEQRATAFMMAHAVKSGGLERWREVMPWIAGLLLTVAGSAQGIAEELALARRQIDGAEWRNALATLHALADRATAQPDVAELAHRLAQVAHGLEDELPTGFLFAGAPAVISTLWAVDDAATRELMADFYHRLLSGEQDRLAAFTAAKKALREKYPDPYYWAPFLYLGSPD
jgi:hypothetical protein